eukprot:GHVH01016720.1.p2 GENE.GHVH01016720.1~~GHVH01016720.1.p2  ORF type:complete len:957 (+),score=160.17 GHVH01016720.1:259-3129(+)
MSETIPFTLTIDEGLIAILNAFHTTCSSARQLFQSSRTSKSPFEAVLKAHIAKRAHDFAKALLASHKKDEDVISRVAKSYGMKSIQLLRRAYLDLHFSIFNVFTAGSDSSLMSNMSSSPLHLEDCFKAAEQGDAAPELDMSKCTLPKEMCISELKKLTFVVRLDADPSANVECSTSGKVEVSYDIIDFNHRSKGRYSAFQYVIFFTALDKAGVKMLPSDPVFMGSREMIKQRLVHATRVYKAIRLDRESMNSTEPRTINIEWFEAIFSSDNLLAMNDVLMDIESELWYMNFFRSEVLVPQYSHLYKDRCDIFALLTALQGHPLEEVRSRALVLLNAFLDDHEWQLYFPLVPRVQHLGDDMLIRFTIENPAHPTNTDGDLLPKGIHLQLCAPPRDVELPTSRGYLSYHQITEWTFAGVVRGVNLWEGSVNLGQYTRCGFYDWRVLTSDEALGSWEVALLSTEKNANFADIPWLNKSNSDGVNVSSVFKLTTRVKVSPVQGRFICQKSITAYPILEYPVGDIGHEDRFRSSSSADHLVESIMSNYESDEQSRFDTVCLRGVLDRKCHSPPSHGSLASSLIDLNKVARDHNMDICVEASFGVDAALYDRRYKDLMTFSVNKGRLAQTYGAEGLTHHLSDHSLLNYRDVKTWKLFLGEVQAWVRSGMTSGVVIEGLGSGVPVFDIDLEEMWRSDADQMPHYTDKEKLLGKVVLPLVVTEKCGSAATWPDPFSVYICKGIWAVDPFAKVIGETVLASATDQLSRSGVVPYVRSLLPVVARSLDLPEAKIPDIGILKAEHSMWFKTRGQSMVDRLHQFVVSICNCVVPGCKPIASSVSPGALTCYGHLEGKAWPFISWLTLLPLQYSFGRNEKSSTEVEVGEQRMQYLLPYIVREAQDMTKDGGSNTPILDDTQRARSFLGSVRSGSHNPHSPLAERVRCLGLSNDPLSDLLIGESEEGRPL